MLFPIYSTNRGRITYRFRHIIAHRAWKSLFSPTVLLM